MALSACGDGGRPIWKGEPAKPGAEAGYLQAPRVVTIRPVRGGLALAGTAAPGARIRLGTPTGELRYASASETGRWTIVIPPSGDLRLFGVSMTVGARTVQAEGYLAVTPGGRAAQLRAGAGALVLAPPSRRPLILALDFDRDGAAMVSGVGTVGAEIGLRLDRAAAGGATIDRQGRYRFALVRTMASAGHVLEISGAGGEQVLTISAGRPAPLGQPFRAERVQGAWRIDWMTPGGGVQSTVLFDPPGVGA
ncbi:MAG: hypothetical protein HY859_05740 [Caulobacterales bacterium]|nr:hypothetical protein [Caulobacterales bacterium]